MALTLAEVEHIAHLARLDLTPAEKDRFREQLSAILDYAARLQALDTAGIQPTTTVASGSGLRADEPRPGLPVDVLLRDAPSRTQGQFRIPPVLE